MSKQERQRGIITSLSRKRNFVFIRLDGDDRDVFCHRSEIESGEEIQRGLLVELELRKDDQQQATNVRILR